MTSMKCFQCLFKHIAGALSYGKEILSGHGEGSDLDHRIDLLGQLVNAEHHADLINKDFAGKIKAFRTDLQGRKMTIDETGLETLRQFYHEAESLENAIEEVVPEQVKEKIFIDKIRDEKKYTIIIDKVNNKEHFDLCLKLIEKNCLNEHEIILLNPEIEIEGMKSFKGSMMKLIEAEKHNMTENFIYMQQDNFIIRPFDFNYMMPVFTQKTPENKIELQLHNLQFYYTFNSGVPQVLNVTTYLNRMYEETTDVLTAYFGITAPEKKKNANDVVVQLSKNICCSNAAKITQYRFACTYNEIAFGSLVDYLRNHKMI